MVNDLENFYLRHEEPAQSALLELRKIILRQDKNITEEWKYSMPFFCYRKKMFCYLWIEKKSGDPYIGFVEGNRIEHPALIKGSRMRMKIMPVNPGKDLPVRSINQVMKQALDLYRKGIIPINTRI